MNPFTLILTLDKRGAVLSNVACLPTYIVPQVDIPARLCANPDNHNVRRRAALWMLMDAKKRKRKGVAGIAIVACQPREHDRVYYADYCFKPPRRDLESGSTLGMAWGSLLYHLGQVSPAAKVKPRAKRARRRA